MKAAHLLALTFTTLAVGCAPATERWQSERPRRSQNVLTQQEMRAAHHRYAYDAVASLRGNWIRPQAPISFSAPHAGQVLVFMDGSILLGDVSFLRRIHVTGIRSLQFLSPTEATARFGIRTNGGPAIVITPANGREDG